ncbi:MAG TPA: hypothetical protein VJG90_00295 [Candidatus Nanoarchaeia archaeon]|nr:hypothetical protein [Candidatus Nanoarchaeia archaeon]
MFVLDASTVILLAKAELLDLLLRDFKGTIAITPKVAEEIGKKATFDAVFIKRRLDEGKIEIKKASGPQVEKIMKDFNLHQGESESIVLALHHKGSLLGTDDKNAINACKLLGITFTTAMGILIRMKEKKLLSSQECLSKWQALKTYGRYKENIMKDAKKRLEE